MRIWTIQPESAWNQLQQTGLLETDTAKLIADYGDLWDWTIEPYEWLAEQMSRRILPRPRVDAYPLWGWYQFCGVKRMKPDLRCAGFVPRGRREVRIEVELPDDAVLLSDFDLWHLPLNCHYLARSLKEDDRWDRELRSRGYFYNPKRLSALPEDLRERVERSWEQVFDLTTSNRYWGTKRDSRRIQATFWKLTRDQVRAVTHFVGR